MRRGHGPPSHHHHPRKGLLSDIPLAALGATDRPRRRATHTSAAEPGPCPKSGQDATDCCIAHKTKRRRRAAVDDALEASTAALLIAEAYTGVNFCR